MAARTQRQFTKVIGRIDADSLYTTEGCLRFAGLGRDSLIQARASGIVKAIPLGKRMYYRGDELIDFIKTHGGRS